MIHHSVYGADADADAVVLRTGAEIGCSLVDGNGDGVCLEAPGLPLELLRRTSFGLLQVRDSLPPLLGWSDTAAPASASCRSTAAPACRAAVQRDTRRAGHAGGRCRAEGARRSSV